MSNKSDQPVQVKVDVNPETTPILYTDNINITMNEDGIVLNFCQLVTPTQLKVVSRIGMSRSHANKFVSKMGSMLVQDEKISVTNPQSSTIKN